MSGVVRVRVLDLVAGVMWAVAAGLGIGASIDPGRDDPFFVWMVIMCAGAAVMSVIAWESRRLSSIQTAYALGRAGRELSLVPSKKS